MKLLFDECIPQNFRHHIPGHDVFTVGFMRWNGTRNGNLLSLAASNGFHALITIDRGLLTQQNAINLPLAVIILDATSDDIDDLIVLIPKLVDLLELDCLKPFTGYDNSSPRRVSFKAIESRV